MIADCTLHSALVATPRRSRRIITRIAPSQLLPGAVEIHKDRSRPSQDHCADIQPEYKPEALYRDLFITNLALVLFQLEKKLKLNAAPSCFIANVTLCLYQYMAISGDSQVSSVAPYNVLYATHGLENIKITTNIQCALFIHMIGTLHYLTTYYTLKCKVIL